MAYKLSRSDLIKALAQRFVIPDELRYPKQGGNASSGYVRRMEAENKLIFNKVSRPSNYLIRKYGDTEQHHNEDHGNYDDHHDAALFADDEPVDFNVGKTKPKKPSRNRGPTEAQEEREEARLRQVEHEKQERKQKQLDDLARMKTLVQECNSILKKEDNTYHEVIDELQHRRGMKKVAKSEMQEKIVVKHLANIKKIKQNYAVVYQYAKTHKLKDSDLNQILKHIRTQVSNITKS